MWQIKMIDIHSHILPSLDDGAESLEESVQMAEWAAEQGTKVMIATPHHLNGFENRAAAIELAVGRLNQELLNRGISLTVLAGQEVRISQLTLEEMIQGHLLPLAQSRYLLIELPASRIPTDIFDIMYELQLRKFVPILAHPERNQEIMKRPEWLQQYIEAGGLVQITAHSLTLHRKLRNRSLSLIKQQLVHLIASDAHNMKNRPPGLKEAYDVVQEEFGEGMATYFQQNAQFILNDEPIAPPPFPKVKRIWKLF